MKDIQNYQFFKNLQNLFFIRSIILYGSRAQGKAKARADIDLAVICPEASTQDWSKVMDIIGDKADTLLKIDCVRLDALPDISPLKANILKEGMVLYKQDG